ncbi:MAG: hypothetical protein V2I33_09920 [Kangiellaceae bacterium]|jgi:hypothetical protein|nr:hypothetical protein [Kangiellaceae bacterium]
MTQINIFLFIMGLTSLGLMYESKTTTPVVATPQQQQQDIPAVHQPEPERVLECKEWPYCDDI